MTSLTIPAYLAAFKKLQADETTTSKEESVLLFDEQLSAIYIPGPLYRRIQISSNKGTWCVAAVFKQHVFTDNVLYEYQRELESKDHLYQRSSFLPQMVGQEKFLELVATCLKTIGNQS